MTIRPLAAIVASFVASFVALLGPMAGAASQAGAPAGIDAAFASFFQARTSQEVAAATGSGTRPATINDARPAMQ